MNEGSQYGGIHDMPASLAAEDIERYGPKDEMLRWNDDEAFILNDAIVIYIYNNINGEGSSG